MVLMSLAVVPFAEDLFALFFPMKVDKLSRSSFFTRRVFHPVVSSCLRFSLRRSGTSSLRTSRFFLSSGLFLSLLRGGLLISPVRVAFLQTAPGFLPLRSECVVPGLLAFAHPTPWTKMPPDILFTDGPQVRTLGLVQLSFHNNPVVEAFTHQFWARA